jgi:transposase, IS30 family
LTLVEREEISRGIAENVSARTIGARLGRDPSVVSREIARNGGRSGYRAHRAAERAEQMVRRPKARKLEANQQLHGAVAAGLAADWSPGQIAGRLRVDHPDDEAMRVSHETIYQALYLQARGELATELKLALRTGRAERVPRGSTRPKQARIAGMVNISERPPEVADRAVPGHWEGDLIIGKRGKSQVATLAERVTRFTKLVRVPYDRTADRVAGRLSAEVEHLPEDLRRSLTWDQGVEMAAHAKFTIATGIPVYFCDPHSPWQRGSNENTNGLLRQYFPKGTDLSGYTQAELDMVADKLNTRPRKVLGWMTPAEKLNELLLSQSGDALTV